MGTTISALLLGKRKTIVAIAEEVFICSYYFRSLPANQFYEVVCERVRGQAEPQTQLFQTPYK
jgi:hypothetical protein